MEQATMPTASQNPAAPPPASQPNAGSKPPSDNNHAAKFAFFYMLSLLALIIMSVSSGIVIFQIINKYIRDYLATYSHAYSADAIRFALSGIFVAAPVYYLTMWQIQKNLRHGALRLDSPVRKWLTYFILFVSSAVSIFWLMGTVNNFLKGEITVRFILKALTAIGISAAIFAFYFYDIKRRQIDERSRFIVRIWFWLTLLAVVAVFVAGLVVEPPQFARAKRHDEIVLRRLHEINSSLEQYYGKYKDLPASLEELSKKAFIYNRDTIYDPDSNQMFVYQKKSANAYKICANFKLADDKLNTWPDFSQQWPHQAGRQCFDKSFARQNSALPQRGQTGIEEIPLNQP